MADKFKFKVGDRVTKPKGYPFPGIVMCAYTNSLMQPRYVVEYTDHKGDPTTLSHIFSPDQLEKAD